jgi:hypothetical protein
VLRLSSLTHSFVQYDSPGKVARTSLQAIAEGYGKFFGEIYLCPAYVHRVMLSETKEESEDSAVVDGDEKEENDDTEEGLCPAKP